MSAGQVYATRKFTFSAAHRYWQAAWSDAENRRVFGSLTVPHGHNYVLEVAIRGLVDAQTGMVMDLAELKRVVSDAVVQRFDHADLNADSLFAQGAIPTTENLVRAAWDLLAPKLGHERLWRLRLWEDPTFYVDYFGHADHVGT
jgi:6-pyruvoyltetrahydropterin/6-carboxytetrahydropterin synthase